MQRGAAQVATDEDGSLSVKGRTASSHNWLPWSPSARREKGATGVTLEYTEEMLEGVQHPMAASTGKSPRGKDVARPPRTERITQPAERITVALIPKAGADLQRLQERTSLSKTDVTNRAITLYEFIDAQIRAGRDVLIRDGKTGETQLVRILSRPACCAGARQRRQTQARQTQVASRPQWAGGHFFCAGPGQRPVPAAPVQVSHDRAPFSIGLSPAAPDRAACGQSSGAVQRMSVEKLLIQLVRNADLQV